MGKRGGGRVRVKQVGPKMPSIGNPLDSFAIPPEDMIQLPPKPNKNAAIIWPLSETFTLKYDGFQVIYPNYLDSTKTVKQGRRISADVSVDTPTVADISGALQAMNIKHVIQPNKCYSRDAESHWDNKGRILVDIQKGQGDGAMELGADGAFDVSDENDVPDMGGGSGMNKKKMLKEIAARIPHLKARKDRLEREAKQKSEAEAKAKAESAAAHRAASSKVSASSNKKKKGKKKR